MLFKLVRSQVTDTSICRYCFLVVKMHHFANLSPSSIAGQLPHEPKITVKSCWEGSAHQFTIALLMNVLISFCDVRMRPLLNLHQTLFYLMTLMVMKLFWNDHK